MANTASAVVKPNLMFVLDDSGSMDRDYMPDSVDDDPACKNTGSNLQDCNFADPPYNSAQFNGIHYNPAITYTPAVNYDGTSRTNYTTWTAVPNDAYGIQFTGNIDLTTSYPDNVWCNTGSATTADRTAPFASGKCKRPIQGGVWTYPNGTYNNQYSAAGTLNPYYYTISSLAWCSSANASGFGTGTCQPKKTATFQYPKYGTGSDGFTRTDIVSTTANYPRAASRTECSGAVGPTGCTYAQEMTNFANWYAYYRTRMQMMKTASGLAFKQVTDSFRVGFDHHQSRQPGGVRGISPHGGFHRGRRRTKEQVVHEVLRNESGRQDAIAGSPVPGRSLLWPRDHRHQQRHVPTIRCSTHVSKTSRSCRPTGSGTTMPVRNSNGTAIGHQDSDPTTAPRPLLDGSFQITSVTSNDTLNRSRSAPAAPTLLAPRLAAVAANFKRVKQQTSSSISTVVSRDGVVLSNTTSTPTTYQDITACNALVTTAMTPTTKVDEQAVNGGATSPLQRSTASARGQIRPVACAAEFWRHQTPHH